jgi:heme/copper-type cytochrome/quinol oxidase subunit 2
MRLLFADGLFWTSVACCLVAQLFIIRSVRGARYVPEPSSALPRRHGGLEMLWAVAPAIGLGVLLLFTWRAMHPPAGVAPVAAPAIQVPA